MIEDILTPSAVAMAGATITAHNVYLFCLEGLAHAALGAALTSLVDFKGYLPRWFFPAFMALIVLKEFAFDIPAGHGYRWVIADSVIDLMFWFLGRAFMFWTYIPARRLFT